MSTVAQKLLDELVEPKIKRSNRDNREPRKYSGSRNNKCVLRSTNSQNNKTTRTIVVEKRKEVNRLVPNNTTASRSKFSSRETLLRKVLVDEAVNTLVTGPLRCDNNCVTMVRKRDNKCSCKCSHKHINYKSSAKHIQTFEPKNFAFTDKACAHCVETVSCGTQFLERLSDRVKSQMKISFKNPNRDTIQPNLKVMAPNNDRKASTMVHNNYGKPANLNYMGARRWALSQYPTRGPDF